MWPHTIVRNGCSCWMVSQMLTIMLLCRINSSCQVIPYTCVLDTSNAMDIIAKLVYRLDMVSCMSLRTNARG